MKKIKFDFYLIQYFLPEQHRQRQTALIFWAGVAMQLDGGTVLTGTDSERPRKKFRLGFVNKIGIFASEFCKRIWK